MAATPDIVDALATEAARLEEGTLYYEHSHRLAAGRWRLVGAVLGASAAILGGLAAALTGAEVGDNWVQVLLGGLGASFAAALTFFKPAERAAQHEQSGIGFNLLRGELRRFRQIDVLAFDHLALHDRMAALTAKRATLLLGPHYSQRTFHRARDDIRRGLFAYTVDDTALMENTSGGAEGDPQRPA